MNRQNGPKPIPVYDASGRHVVGVVTGAVFRKAVKGTAHQLRQPPAWAFDVASLDAAERAGAVIVELVDVETETVYRATLAAIRRDGFTFNRGFGQQRGLVLGLWETVTQERPHQLSLLEN